MKVNKDFLNIGTAISLMEFYLKEGKISEFEGNFILKQLEKSQSQIKKEIIQDFEEIFTNTMVELKINDWWALADSEDFEIVRKSCKKLESYDSGLFEKWEGGLFWDI